MDTKKPPSTAQKNFGELAPKLVQLTDDVLFGDVWERPQLSKRDRSLITCAALVADGRRRSRWGLPFPPRRRERRDAAKSSSS